MELVRLPRPTTKHSDAEGQVTLAVLGEDENPVLTSHVKLAAAAGPLVRIGLKQAIAIIVRTRDRAEMFF
jgi:hypothetical protein